MHALVKTSLSRTGIIAALALAGAGGVLLAAGSGPAMALCKYGTPNCIDKNPMAKFEVKVNDTRIPDSTWVDPDCEYYGNCQSPNSALQAQGGKTVRSMKAAGSALR